MSNVGMHRFTPPPPPPANSGRASCAPPRLPGGAAVTAKRLCRLAAAALAAFALHWGAQRAPAQTYTIDTFAGGGGTAVLTTLNAPRGVAVDSNGNVYVGDVSNHRVIRIDGATKNSSVFAGTGSSGFSGDGAAAASAQLNEPYGVAVDSNNNVFIADTGNRRLRLVTISTGNITTHAGTGASGSGNAFRTSATFSWIYDVATDSSNNVYIADRANSLVRLLTASSGQVSNIMGPNVAGVSIGAVEGVSVDSSGNLWAASHSAHRVFRRTSSGTGSVFAGSVTLGFGGDGGAATSARLSNPRDAAADSSGNVYIADASNHRIRRVDTSGNISTFAGTGTASSTGDGGAASSATLNFPEKLALDSSNNIYIGERGGNRVRKIDTSGNISTIAGLGPTAVGDGAAASSSSLNGPLGAAVDSSGNVYIADTAGHRIRRVDASTSNISTFAGTGTAGNTGDGAAATSALLSSPSGVAVDASGNVYIADSGNNRVRRVDTSGNIAAFAGTGTAGNTGDGAAATSATLDTPIGVAVDASGNVYIADTDNRRVRRVDTSGNIAAFAGTGTAGNTGDGGAATSATLTGPRGVAADASGNVYIADTSHHRVRRVNTSGNIAAFAGTGTSGNTGDGAAATSATLSNPRGVAVDSAGNVYIADTGNHRIRKVDTSGNIANVAGASAGFSGDGGAALSAALDRPYGVAVDSSGNLFVADRGNHRVRKLTTDTPITPMPVTPPPTPDPDPPPPPTPDPDPSPTPDPDPTPGTGTGSGSGTGRPEPTAQPVGGAGELTFEPAEDSEPTSKTLTLRAENGAVDYRVTPSARWIEVTRAASGAAQWRGRLEQGETIVLQVTVNPLGLREGRHEGRLYIRSNGRLTATIGVVLEVPPPTGPAVTENGGVLNAARQSAYGEPGLFGPRILPVAPGSVVEIRGRNLAADGAASAEGLPLPRSLGGTRVMIDGQAAPLFTVESGRIAAQLPSGLLPEGARTALASVEVETEQGVSYARFFHAAAQAPGVFTVSGGGAGQGSIVFAGTAELAAPRGYGEGAARPARAGDVLEIYATGLGALEPAPSDGEAGGAAVLRHAAAAVRVWLGSQPLAAEDVLFAGGAPSLVGVNVILARVPAGIAPNDALEVHLEVGGARSQPGVTIAVE